MSLQLMKKVWEMDIPTNMKMVCLSLSDLANDDGECCYPSIATICKRCSMEERAVRRNIQALEDLHVLWREYRTGHSTLYHLTPDRYQSTATPPHGGPLPMVGTPPHGGPQPLPMADPPPPPMVDPHNHQLTINTQRKNSLSSIGGVNPVTHAGVESAPTPRSLTLVPPVAKVVTDWPGFDDFWAAYPEKKSKKDARTAWNKLRPSSEIIKAILADLPRRIAQDRRWLDGYIPNPATYLNGERWQDSITPKLNGSHHVPRSLSKIDVYTHLDSLSSSELFGYSDRPEERRITGEVL